MMTLVLDTSVRVYRQTIKRVPPLHNLFHRLSRSLLLPTLEGIGRFRTISDDPFWFRLELLLRRHERETMQQVKASLKPGMTVLDIGAHVGYYARTCAEIVGEGGRVFAFEPHPRTYAILQDNVAPFRNVTAIQAAVSSEAGTAQLYDYLMMSASGSLHYDENLVEIQKANVASGDVAPRLEADFPVNTFEVQTIQIDEFLRQQDIARVDFVKMDIEGAELQALQGMAHTIKQSPGMVLVMEFNPTALKAFGHDPQTAVQDVLALGFQRVSVIEADGSLRDVTNSPQEIAALTVALMEKMDVVNLMFRNE